MTSASLGLGTDDLAAFHVVATGKTYLVAQDGLHGTRAVLDKGLGQVRATWRSRAYGAVLDSAAGGGRWDLVPVVRYRGAGQQWDPETGFYHMRARYYDPSVQRFTQDDPSNPFGDYGYADGNPTDGRDPSGLTKDYDRFMSMPDRTARIMEWMGCWSAACDGAWHRGEAWVGFGKWFLTLSERYRSGSVSFSGERESEAYFNAKGEAARLDALLYNLFTRLEQGSERVHINFGYGTSLWPLGLYHSRLPLKRRSCTNLGTRWRTRSLRSGPRFRLLLPRTARVNIGPSTIRTGSGSCAAARSFLTITSQTTSPFRNVASQRYASAPHGASPNC